MSYIFTHLVVDSEYLIGITPKVIPSENDYSPRGNMRELDEIIRKEKEKTKSFFEDLKRKQETQSDQDL